MKKTLVLVLSLCVASFAFASNVDKAAIEEALAAYEAGIELTKAQDALVSQYGGGGNAIDNFGGPDAFGYTWQDSEEVGGPVYAWNDITGTGTSVIGDMGDDVTAGPYPVGFAFPFYGINYSNFYISSNGAINFNGQYISLINQMMPTATYLGMIAWFWDDLDPADATDADVLYETITIGNQNALVISFLNWDEYAGNTDPDGQEDITAQLVLFEDGTIQMHYMSVESAAGLDISSCTIGIQDATGSIGLTALYNASIADYPYDELAIEFSTDVVADASLSGYVYDSVTEDPIQDAVVTLGYAFTTTNALGFYEFLDVYSNTYPWTVAATGYLSQNGMIDIVPGANVLDFYLDIWDPTGDILVVDVDETIDSGPQIDAIMTGLGYTTYYTNDFYEVPFTDYEHVFICLGMFPNDFLIDDGTPEETAVIDYLNAGGNLYVEGGDFLGFTPPMTLAGMFNIDAQADGGADLANVIGEDYMAGADMPYTGENSWVDHLEPLDTAVRVFNNPSDGAGCGIVDNGIEGYNYAIFAFEVGMLTDNEFTRQDIMVGVMDVFGGGVLPSELIVSPLELDFGTIFEGETAVLPLQMTVNGDTPIIIDEYTFEFPTGFSMDLIVPYTIEPEEELVVDVTFAPPAAADWSSDLWIHSDAINPIVTVGLIAEAIVGNASELVVSPLELDFGTIMEGETAVLPLQMSVNGDTPIIIDDYAFEFPTGFSMDLIVPHTLQPGDILDVDVTFAPPSAADWSSNLWISSDATNPIVTVSLIADATINAVSEGDDLLPTSLEVSGAYPNPFNASTVIKIRAPHGRTINAVIYDVRGREVYRYEAYRQGGSTTQLAFEADTLPSGLYFCRVTDGVTSVSQKLVLLK